jgi:hypothetical protein
MGTWTDSVEKYRMNIPMSVMDLCEAFDVHTVLNHREKSRINLQDAHSGYRFLRYIHNRFS